MAGPSNRDVLEVVKRSSWYDVITMFRISPHGEHLGCGSRTSQCEPATHLLRPSGHLLAVNCPQTKLKGVPDVSRIRRHTFSHLGSCLVRPRNGLRVEPSHPPLTRAKHLHASRITNTWHPAYLKTVSHHVLARPDPLGRWRQGWSQVVVQLCEHFPGGARASNGNLTLAKTS
jgi:hypothetical protein